MEASDLSKFNEIIRDLKDRLATAITNLDVARSAGERLQTERDHLHAVLAETPANRRAMFDAWMTAHNSYRLAWEGQHTPGHDGYWSAVLADQRSRAGVSDQSVVAEMHYLRWWYVMHMPEVTGGKLPTKEEMRELWKKNTGNEVPKGYTEEDEVW